MTRIADLLGDGPTVSFEFFPPKTAEGRTQLDACVTELAVIDPTFVSVTYGAGGSTRDLTRDLVVDIDSANQFPAMPHLTCVGHRRAELVALLDDYHRSGIENILALAGDPPEDGAESGGDFTRAVELVELVRSTGDFSVAVAAFPEVHPRSASTADDRRHLADKLNQADFGITQFFFDAGHYRRMRDDLDALGCTTPVLPGIMPMVNPAVIRRFAAMNGTSFPEDLAARVADATPDDAHKIAVESAVEMCDELLADGAPGLHLYCLNKSELALDVLSGVGLR